MADKVETPDWPAQATDTIVKVVGQVRDKTTGPIIKVARVIVYGTLAAILGVIAAVVGCILVIRVAMIPVEYFWDSDRVWVVYLILGTIFLLAGWFVMRKASASPADR
jgi:hypothetical protein